MHGWHWHGPKLRALRAASGISVAEMARSAGCHVNHYRKIENYGQQPGDLIAHRILAALAAVNGRQPNAVLADIADIAAPRPEDTKQAS